MVRQDSTTKERSLPKTKLGPKAVPVKNKSSDRDAISPTAARGIEVKRNISKRSRASSVPQRKIDLDKELLSWKFAEEEK